MSSWIALRTKIKTAVKRIALQVGLYSLLVNLFGFLRGLQLKQANDQRYQQRVKFWRNQKRLQRPRQKQYNFIWLIWDAWRADYFNSTLTPSAWKLGEKGWRAPRHYTVSPWTWPTVNSLLTGLYPHQHGARIEEDLKAFNRLNFPRLLPLSIPTFVDFLRPLGYHCRWLSSVVTADLALQGIFPRSFRDQVQWDNQPFAKLRNKAQQFIRQHKQEPFFLYLHAGDLHMPIQVPRRYLENESSPSSPWARIDYFENQPQGDFAAHQKRRQQFYRAALRYLDDQLQQFLSFLESENLWSKTIIFLSADHGEEMGDHRALEEKIFQRYRPHLLGREHGYSLFEEIIRVPAVLAGGKLKKKLITAPTHHLDLLPTLFALQGWPADSSFSGVSWLEEPTPRALFVEECAYGYEQKAVIKEQDKLIHSAGYNFEIYENLATGQLQILDPKKNYPAPIPELRQLLQKFSRREQQKGEKTKTNAAIKNRLSRLGYL